MQTLMAQALELRMNAARLETRFPDWKDSPFLRDRLRRMYERAWYLEGLAEAEALKY